MAEKDEQYTKPKLREKLKEQIKQGTKGGKAGQWSARKAQLLVQEYEKQGGGYKKSKGKSQKHLEKWQKEDWRTADGKKAEKSDGTVDRYLPDKAWKNMSESEKRKTRQVKKKKSQSGQQYVANTGPAKNARRKATSSSSSSSPRSTTRSSRYSASPTRTNKSRTAAAKRKSGRTSTALPPSQLVERPVREVLEGMKNYDKRQLRSLRQMEERRKARSTVLKAIDKRLG